MNEAIAFGNKAAEILGKISNPTNAPQEARAKNKMEQFSTSCSIPCHSLRRSGKGWLGKQVEMI